MIGNGSTERIDGGISDFGSSIIKRMNEIGMAIDVSHCGDQTTLDAFDISKKPVLITHSNVRALNPNHPRCKPDGVIKKMESLLSENNIKPIDAIGEIFDPKLHEAVSTINDDSLDEGTIPQEVAKGYISFQDVIRPSKVIVSKKNKEE